MKSNVFFDIAASLDGFIAPEGMDMAHAADPEYKQWLSLWSKLQGWVFQQKFFRENLKLGEGGETGHDNRMLEETFKRTGVSIVGKRMFEGGELFWPEEAPFHTPVFVLTHEVRKPWVRPGGHHIPLRERWYRERAWTSAKSSWEQRYSDRWRR